VRWALSVDEVAVASMLLEERPLPDKSAETRSTVVRASTAQLPWRQACVVRVAAVLARANHVHTENHIHSYHSHWLKHASSQ
jgi:hypothetical protein